MKTTKTGYQYRGVPIVREAWGWSITREGRTEVAQTLADAKYVVDTWNPDKARQGWGVRYDTGADPDGPGTITVEDEDRELLAVVPFGGKNRLGFAAAERLARQIVQLCSAAGGAI